MKQDLMKGVIDMHVHTNPDLRLRAYDDFELMEAAIRVGARAIVIKTHQGTTMDRAYLCNRHNEIVHGKTNNFTMFGSITLNKVVGGINPKAVDVALRLGAKVVWLPTQSAMNQDLSQSVEVVKDGKIVPELRSVLELIRDHNAVLGTAHIAPEEIFTVVEAARDMGVKNIVVTHPEWWIVGMSHEDQLRLVKDYDVIAAMHRTWAVESIRAIWQTTWNSSKRLAIKMSWLIPMAARQKTRIGSWRWQNICSIW